MKHIRDWFWYLVIRWLAVSLGALPMRFSYRAGEFLGLLGFWLDRRHRLRGQQNLERAFPGELSARQMRRLQERSWAHFGMVLVDLVYLPRLLRPYNWQHYIEYPGIHLLQEAARQRKPAIVVGGHLGNWELAGWMTAMLGVPLSTVVKVFPNAMLASALNRLRSWTGQQLILQEGALRQSIRTLREGRTLGILMDQNAGRSGVFVPFFGRLASTVRTPAILALRYGAALFPFYSFRKRPGPFHRIEIEPALVINPTGDEEEDIRRITAAVTAALEKRVREHPEQWLWPHRRWKSRPPSERLGSEVPDLQSSALGHRRQ